MLVLVFEHFTILVLESTLILKHKCLVHQSSFTDHRAKLQKYLDDRDEKFLIPERCQLADATFQKLMFIRRNDKYFKYEIDDQLELTHIYILVYQLKIMTFLFILMIKWLYSSALNLCFKRFISA